MGEIVFNGMEVSPYRDTRVEILQKKLLKSELLLSLLLVRVLRAKKKKGV